MEIKPPQEQYTDEQFKIALRKPMTADINGTPLFTALLITDYLENGKGDKDEIKAYISDYSKAARGYLELLTDPKTDDAADIKQAADYLGFYSPSLFYLKGLDDKPKDRWGAYTRARRILGIKEKKQKPPPPDSLTVPSNIVTRANEQLRGLTVPALKTLDLIGHFYIEGQADRDGVITINTTDLANLLYNNPTAERVMAFKRDRGGIGQYIDELIGFAFHFKGLTQRGGMAVVDSFILHAGEGTKADIYNKLKIRLTKSYLKVLTGEYLNELDKKQRKGNGIFYSTLPQKLLTIDGRSETTYRIGRYLVYTYTALKKARQKNYNRIKTSTILNITTIEPSEYNRKYWTKKLKAPTEKALNSLLDLGILTAWSYSEPPSSYAKWLDTVIIYELNDKAKSHALPLKKTNFKKP